MRPTTCLGLLAFALLAVGIRSASLAGPRQGPVGPAAAVPAPEVVVVDGYGRDPAAARERAFENGRDKVRELLEKRYASVGWLPSDEQLREDILLRHQVIRPLGEPRAEVDHPGRGVKASVEVQLTPSFLEEVKRQIRELRVHERHWVLARILAGLVVLLLVLGGYLRLEEATRGYYTQALRVTALLLVAATAAGLWLSVRL
jgi:hypothetical protein